MMRIWGTVCCLIAMITAVLALHLADGSAQASQSQQQSQVLSFEQTVADLHWLYAVINPLRAEELRLVASSYAVIDLQEGVSPKDIASRILQPFDTRYIDVQEDERSAMAVAALPDDVTVSISVQAQSSAEALIVARLEATQLADIDSESVILGWWSQIDERWVAELGERPEWRINLQAGLALDLLPGDLWDALEAAEASPVDEAGHYHDSGSASRVYHAPQLHHAVLMQDDEVQLQAALHRSSEDQTYRITLGTPLITIEY